MTDIDALIAANELVAGDCIWASPDMRQLTSRSAAAIRELRDRLELTNETAYDGIDCRNETIKQQDKIIEELREENTRLTGAMCLICGRKEPCAETPDACTFDPNPIQAAQMFLRRAERAESALAAAQKDAERLRKALSRLLIDAGEGSRKGRAFDLLSKDVIDAAHVALDPYIDAAITAKAAKEQP